MIALPSGEAVSPSSVPDAEGLGPADTRCLEYRKGRNTWRRGTCVSWLVVRQRLDLGAEGCQCCWAATHRRLLSGAGMHGALAMLAVRMGRPLHCLVWSVGFMLRAASAWSVSLFGMQVSMVWQLVRFPDGIAVSWWSIFYCFCPGVLESIFASTAASGCSNTPAGCACVAHSGCCQRGAQPASTLVAPGTMAGCSWRNALSCKLLAA
jgi:hypothetical protein